MSGCHSEQYSPRAQQLAIRVLREMAKVSSPIRRYVEGEDTRY